MTPSKIQDQCKSKSFLFLSTYINVKIYRKYQQIIPIA